VIEPTMRDTLTDIYRRERLSFLQYVRQAAAYAGPADRPVLERVRELGAVEAAGLDGLAEYLDRNHVSIPHVGAFPTPFTNYNFVAVRKLLPHLVEDEARGLAALERDVAVLPPGESRTWAEKLAESKRMHLTELVKIAQ
jgi:hypothetical protein